MEWHDKVVQGIMQLAILVSVPAQFYYFFFMSRAFVYYSTPVEAHRLMFSCFGNVITGSVCAK